MAFWNPLTCLTACLIVYTIGEFLSKKTKGAIASLLFACILFLGGFWTGILPKDVTTQSGLTTIMSNFGTALMITNIGSLIDIEELISEWKTVVIALCAIVAIAIICFTVGSWAFGRDYALIAAPPVAGSTVAGIIVTSAAEAANRPELAAFAVLVLSFQKFFGIPISTTGIRSDLRAKLASGYFDVDHSAAERIKLPSMRIFPKPAAGKKQTNTVLLCRIAIVGCIAYFAGNATKIAGSDPARYILDPNIAYLLFGMIATRIGFINKDDLVKGNSSGILTFGLLLMLPGSLAQVTPQAILSMLIPTFGILLMCAIGICLLCAVVGKVLGYSPKMSAAIGVTCMLAYPATQIITTEAVDSIEGMTPEQRQRAMDYALPKMIIGGFVTVTIASVIFAGIISPMIFA